MNAPARLTLRTLGVFTLEYDARACHLAYEKGRALLAFLATPAGAVHERAALAAMFWPKLERDAALTNLRQVLRDLRRALNEKGLEAPPLHVDRESVRIDAAAIGIDIERFAVAAPGCPDQPIAAHCKVCLGQMDKRAGLYQGEFMAGFSLPDCPDFEAWLQIQREAFHLHALALLARQAQCLERNGAYAKALPAALRFLELEPWSEEGLRRVMRLYALTGRGANALARYESACLVLNRELGVRPGEETRALAKSIERGELSPAASTITAAQTAGAAVLTAERRQVTALYCELAAVAADDPDLALELLDLPQARCAEIIRHYSGYLVQPHGGGLLAYFGFPQASEHAARHAVQAALALTRTHFPGLELRAGVHTGVVISGTLQVPDAIGASSGLAMRLRQVAECGEVAISAATQRLIAGYFACRSLGLRQLRGIARPLEVFTVLGESGARDRIEAEARLTPLVGRADEIAALLALWHEVRRPHAKRPARRVVLLTGEAGVGKSRVLLAVKEAVRAQGGLVSELRCFPEHKQSPFYPLLEWFAAVLAFAPDDSASARFDKLAAYVAAHCAKCGREAAPDVVPLLAKLLGLPLREPYFEPDLSPQRRRERTLAIIRECHETACTQPVLLAVEDLQWADPSTLELLTLCLASGCGAPLLAILTARPGFQLPCRDGLATSLPLAALGAAETAALIVSLAPALPPATVRRIVARADGIPLFAEELARDFAGDDQSLIPSTLLDLLTARLDGMGSAKTLAQAAASVGREFSSALLGQITPFDTATLTQLFAQLNDAGLLYRGGSGALCFKHALIHDAAYQSQTRGEREAMHRRIATALTAMGEARPEILAQHWAAGGEFLSAAACFAEAGRLASTHSASLEAIAHFRSGLALIEALPDGAERGRLELDLQIGLGTASSAVHGYAFAEGTEFYERALALDGAHGNEPGIFQAIWRLWSGASSRAGYVHAQQLAQQLLRMAVQSADPVHLQQAHFAVANTFYWQGEFANARAHLEAVAASYRPAHHADHVAGFGEDAGITAAAYLSWVLCLLGFPDQAGQASLRALTLARQLRHPFTLAYALTFAALLNCRLGQPQDALALARETLALARQHGFALWEIGATLAQGWALALQKRGEGVKLIERCAESTRVAMGGVTLVVLEPLVQACMLLGNFGAAQKVCAEALAVGVAIADRHVEAELHRLHGECLLNAQPADEVGAESCFQKALALAREQQAKSLQLRAAMSLARLWHQQGKRAGALALLEEIYYSFSEGFTTVDLRAARELLGSLSGKRRS